MAQILWIIVLVLILAVVIIVGVTYNKIVGEIRHFFRLAFNTSNISDGIEKMQEEYATTPKSVSGLTSLYLPKISKDFPDFNFDEMKERANNVLTSYLVAISQGNNNALSEGNEELQNKLKHIIESQQDSGEMQRFKQIKLHRTEINQYQKKSGRCIVTFQTSLQSYYKKMSRDGKVLEGSDEFLTQEKYDIDLIYIQDRNLIETEMGSSIGVNCPNCGAPISSLGAKFCEYCASPIIELNIKVWTFSDVRKTG